MINVQNLKLIRAKIATEPARMTRMDRTGDPVCGTPGCIAGWACGLADTSAGDGLLSYEAAANWLGMPYTLKGQFSNLTLAQMIPFEIADLEITRGEVLRALDSLIEDPTREMPAWPDRVIEALSHE